MENQNKNTLVLYEVFNKHMGHKYNGNTVTHFHDYTIKDLEDVLAMYPNTCFDLAGSRFSKKGITPILAEMSKERGITFIDTKRKAMNDCLKEQQERAQEAKVSCDCDLPELGEIKDFVALFNYCNALDPTKKYRAKLPNCMSTNLLTNLVIFIQMARPEIKICLGSIESIVIGRAHDAFSGEVKWQDYAKESWYVTVDGRSYSVKADEHGVFDLGPNGKVGLDTIWYKYCGVPTIFGSRETISLWPASGAEIANKIIAATFKGRHIKLADILTGGL